MSTIKNSLEFYPIKKTLYIPIKDKNGLQKDKVLKVIEGSTIHKKLLNLGVNLSDIKYIYESN